MWIDIVGVTAEYRGTKVAIKRAVKEGNKRSGLPPEDFLPETKRFLTEARLIGGLDHPNVIALHEVCLDHEGKLFYSMKRIDAKSSGSGSRGLREDRYERDVDERRFADGDLCEDDIDVLDREVEVV